MEFFANFFSPIRTYDYSTILFFGRLIGGLLSAALVWGIGYSVFKTKEVLEEQKVFDDPRLDVEMRNRGREEWEKIIKRGASDMEGERKAAVLSADALLDSILKLSGYSGENLGDRLKQIEPSDLQTLNLAWEAHKVRNRLAHEANFNLSEVVAKNTLLRYERVFKELKYL
jgi:hypothetical protein